MIGFGWFKAIMERRKVKRRLAEVMLTRSRSGDPLLVPEFCPVCGREIKQPVRMREITPQGSRVILVCHICDALGPMDSVITAALERQKGSPQSLPGSAHLVGSHLNPASG